MKQWLTGGDCSEVLSITSSVFLSQRQLSAYRGLCAVFLLYTIVAGALVQMQAPYILYLTNWMVMLNFCYFTTSTLALVLPSRPAICKLAYHLNEICLPNSVTVCLLFWTIVFPRLDAAAGPVSAYSYFRVITDHGGTLTLLLVDYAISHTVFRASHVYWPALIFLYIPVSAAYTLVNEQIYPGLTYCDWVSLGFVLFAALTTLSSFSVLVYMVPSYKHVGRQEELVSDNSHRCNENSC